MFKEAVIHYPKDEKALAQIRKELMAFRCDAAVKYIESLDLSHGQIETLLCGLREEGGISVTSRDKGDKE